jgi:hypothetical protein
MYVLTHKIHTIRVNIHDTKYIILTGNEANRFWSVVEALEDVVLYLYRAGG